MTEIINALFKTNPKESWAVIGNFDGVHLGHQALITRLVAKARDVDARSVLVTFNPHPRTVLNSSNDSFLLTTQEEKLDKLQELQLDLVVNLEFSEELSRLSGIGFIQTIKDNLGVIGILSGEQVAFGHDRLGETTPLVPELNRMEIAYEVVAPVLFEGKEISSGIIRNSLADGAIDKVNQMLGAHYQISGRVGHGRKFGQLINLPTANLIIDPHKMLPGNGVYACLAWVRGEPFPAVTNIGVRPTFELDYQLVVEAHLLDFDDNIYGEEVRLSFFERIRSECKFENADLLQAQILRDKNEARRIMHHAI